MNEKLASINDLNPIAARIRERQEEIQAARNKALACMGDTIALIQDQGRDIILAKTKLGKHLKWSEWLANHVPQLPEAMAAKFERVATEQITDPRQCIFAFLPAPEQQDKDERIPPKPWERAWGFVYKLTSSLKENPVTQWPKPQVEATRASLEPLAKELWPEKF